MSKATVIKSSEVKAYVWSEMYSSKMLIDQTNSATKNVQVNQGFIPPSTRHPDHWHQPPYDEVYLIMKGAATIHLDGVEHETSAGDVIFIPAGAVHAIENKSETEELVIFTVWSQLPEQGANEVYDRRLADWGKSYKTIHEE